MAQTQTDLFAKPQHLSIDQQLYKELLQKHKVGLAGKYPLYPAIQIKAYLVNQIIDGNLTAEDKEKLVKIYQNINGQDFYFLQRPYHLQRYAHVQDFLTKIIDKKEQEA